MRRRSFVRAAVLAYICTVIGAVALSVLSAVIQVRVLR